MSYRYVATLDDQAGVFPHDAPAPNTLGLTEVYRAGSTRLFAPAGTPVMEVPCGGAIVGHLFLRDGRAITHSAQIPAGASPDKVRAFVLEQCWGEYILLQRERSGAVVVTRDPSGGVPCVYANGSATRFVTSDISLATGLGLYTRQVDWESVAHYLTYPYLKTARTSLAGIRELLPGCVLRVHGSELFDEMAWSPWTFVEPTGRLSNADKAAAQVRQAVQTVVGSLGEVDETVLVELSGGLDSSVVAACLRAAGARVECVTFVPEVPGADERHYAAPVASLIGASLHAAPLRIEDARIDAPPPPWATSPGVAPLQYTADQVAMRFADRANFTSFYSGGGGDTVFAYLHNASPAADAFRALGTGACLAAIRDLSDLYQCTLWKAARLTLKKLAGPPRPPSRADHSLISREARVHLPDPHPWFDVPATVLPGDRERVLDLAGTQLLKQGLFRGLDYRLRLPLLSQPVVETCLRIPSWMWIQNGHNRSVARAAFRDVLPPEVINRRSKGSFTQYCGSVYQRHKSDIRDYLLGGELRARGLIDPEALEAFFSRPPAPRDESFMRTFTLCTVESWVRHQGQVPPCPSAPV